MDLIKGYNRVVLAKNLQHCIIGGTIKGATSSLFNFVSAHPEVCGSRIKETFFFSQIYSGDAEQDYERYASFFSPKPENRILLEASPNYLAYKENLAPKIKQLFPDAKLLFVLRNPVSRIYSHFNFAKGKLELPQDMSFEQFVEYCERFNKGLVTPAEVGIAETHLRALEIGCYGKYLSNFYDVFEPENIRVLFFEDLNRNPLAQLGKICEFMDISPTFYDDYVRNNANVTFSARIRLLHQIVLHANRLLEPALRKFPGFKQKLVALYKSVNRNRQGSVPMGEDVRKKLVAFYAASNVKVKSILNGQKMPPWIDQAVLTDSADSK